MRTHLPFPPSPNPQNPQSHHPRTQRRQKIHPIIPHPPAPLYRSPQQAIEPQPHHPAHQRTNSQPPRQPHRPNPHAHHHQSPQNSRQSPNQAHRPIRPRLHPLEGRHQKRPPPKRRPNLRRNRICRSLRQHRQHHQLPSLRKQVKPECSSDRSQPCCPQIRHNLPRIPSPLFLLLRTRHSERSSTRFCVERSRRIPKNFILPIPLEPFCRDRASPAQPRSRKGKHKQHHHWRQSRPQHHLVRPSCPRRH
jgi:hypothetical protein